jgi:cyclophilin family peptidyl-prolyl cis-trans isomerase
MRFLRLFFVSVLGLAAALARAQSTAPVAGQSIATQTLVAGDAARTIELSNHFSVPGVGEALAQFDTVFGKFFVELLPTAAPNHVQNFQRYLAVNLYNNSFIHRAASFESNNATSIIQGGGYRYSDTAGVTEIPKFSAVALEYNLPNARGTLAAARSNDPNSATSEWYINTRDNSAALAPNAQSQGYTVFGRVLGSGMNVVDQIAALTRYDLRDGNAGSPFGEVPLRNVSGGGVSSANLVIVNSVRSATKLPQGGASVVTFTVQNSAPGVVSHTLSNSNLTLTPLAAGEATITVRATDGENASAETSFVVRVTANPPTFTQQPVAQTVAAGSTVVFNARATSTTKYQWRRNGTDIIGANSSALVLNNVTGASAGTYTVVAENAFGQTTSNPAQLAVADNAGEVGRLINLSILTAAGAGSRALTVGAVVGPIGSGNSLPLVVRAVGPGLAAVGVTSGTLADPQMALFSSSNSETPIATNDNWSADATQTAALAAAFTSVGAFALPAGSLDAAIFRPTGVAAGGYTVQVSGKGSDDGLVLAEIYDASAAARTAGSPRLINVSVLKVLDPGASMTAGFVIGGATARTVLIRAIGPGLANVGVTSGFLADPVLELFNGASAKIAENDNWEGQNHLSIAGAAVGAFPVTNSGSLDAMMLTTLAPGNYTARVTGAGGTGGNVIVEVYEVP